MRCRSSLKNILYALSGRLGLSFGFRFNDGFALTASPNMDDDARGIVEASVVNIVADVDTRWSA